MAEEKRKRFKQKKRNKRNIYAIIHVNHGVKKSTICSKKTEDEIYKEFRRLLKENKKVQFPMRFNNEEHVMIPSEHEIVIVKCKDYLDEEVNKVKSDSGEFVNYKTNNENWIVVDRAPYEIEETFWVYGFHPRFQRKTYQWILDELVFKGLNSKYTFKTILVYHNKLLIECDGNLEMVICKNKIDSARMYNKIEEIATEKKKKNIIFMGDIKNSIHKNSWIQKIKDLTGWNNKKIGRSSTRD